MLGSFVIIQGITTSFAREPYSFVIFKGGGADPSGSAHALFSIHLWVDFALVLVLWVMVLVFVLCFELLSLDVFVCVWGGGLADVSPRVLSSFEIISLRNTGCFGQCVLACCGCWCSLPLPHGVVDWYAVCECGLSPSYSLFGTYPLLRNES